MNGREPFLSAAATLLRESGCTVIRWRTSISGRAHTDSSDWEIEVPEPRGPLSFGCFAHEVGHQLLHRTGSKPRWREEVEAEEYALAQFERFELPGATLYHTRAVEHVKYTFAKALRRSRRPAGALAADIVAAFPTWWAHAEAFERSRAE